MTLTALLGFSEPVYQTWFGLFGAPPRWVFSSIFGAALAAHAAEATYAHRRADGGGENPNGWWFQTLLLGYPSLRLLLAKTPPLNRQKAKRRRERAVDPRIHS